MLLLWQVLRSWRKLQAVPVRQLRLPGTEGHRFIRSVYHLRDTDHSLTETCQAVLMLWIRVFFSPKTLHFLLQTRESVSDKLPEEKKKTKSDVFNHCLYCIQDGTMSCVREKQSKCPRLTCPREEQFTVPGQCCTFCRGAYTCQTKFPGSVGTRHRIERTEKNELHCLFCFRDGLLWPGPRLSQQRDLY